MIDVKKYFIRVHAHILTEEIRAGRRKSDQAAKSKARIIQLKKEVKEMLTEDDYTSLTKR
jgi:hypothetical protein